MKTETTVVIPLSEYKKMEDELKKLSGIIESNSICIYSRRYVDIDVSSCDELYIYQGNKDETMKAICETLNRIDRKIYKLPHRYQKKFGNIIANCLKYS